MKVTNFSKYFRTMLPEDLKEKVERSNKHLFDKYHSIASIWAKIFHSPLVLERFVWAWYSIFSLLYILVKLDYD